MNELIGRTIVGTRNLTQDERDVMDWRHAEVLILDDGTELVPVKDAEGNDAGVFWHCELGELLE
ncbi:hypothetical protein MHM88_14675 [Epibacterium sp. MM17-32]|uniref:hypothetical protein n=1 Tax=Epibacterium sp. MM17-32 TaxID=2917734 RepID=UPI001EF69D83|nr:hypothetical protein [Epibacterium sp. MM17-32]MCG7629053.1 hypothetical protein [Epibacterium sp. MM17-32]